jgi:hypothetical protein
MDEHIPCDDPKSLKKLAAEGLPKEVNWLPYLITNTKLGSMT